MENKDVRWVQRFNNYQKAFKLLSNAIRTYLEYGMTETEKAGMIQFFQMVYELAWNTMKDFYEDKGEINIQGSRDAIRLAFNRGLIIDGSTWMKMVESRRLSVHTYNEEIANKVIEEITEKYFELFTQLEKRLESEKHGA